ncbi:MAG: YbjQ family protein [Planctomycetota bacterium]|nr:YbjQ family protein [Planctomycetota bacterium]
MKNVYTTDSIPGKTITEGLGIVRGSSVRARHFGRDIGAFFKNIVGGEVEEYTKLLAEAREQALDRMVAEAKAKGADAIVGVRFCGTEIQSGAAEMLAYGTAVKLGD